MTTTPTLTLCELADPGLPGLESYSPFCLKANRALRASGLVYTRRHMNRPDAVKPFSPAGQVPVLLAGGEAIADSSQIVRRLPSLGGASLVASDRRERAEQRLAEELADTAVNGFLVAARWADDDNWARTREAYFPTMPAPVKWLVTPKLRARVIGALHARDVWRAGPDACWARFEELLDDLDARAPKSGFWTGDRVSIADVALFGQLRSFRTPLTPRQGESVGKRGALAAWIDRVDAATSSTQTSAPRPPSAFRRGGSESASSGCLS
jgi:glutathione S-transferase